LLVPTICLRLRWSSAITDQQPQALVARTLIPSILSRTITPQTFDGTLGKVTVTAIKAFQKANGLTETGAFSDDLVKKGYKVGGEPWRV